jgi:hypothetical protein
MTREPYRRPVGSCYFCGGNVRAGDNAYVKDATVGVSRLTHRGPCHDNLDGRLNPGRVLGGTVEVFDPVVTAAAGFEGKKLVLVRMTVSELVDVYLDIDRQETPDAPELTITLAGRSIVPDRTPKYDSTTDEDVREGMMP